MAGVRAALLFSCAVSFVNALLPKPRSPSESFLSSREHRIETERAALCGYQGTMPPCDSTPWRPSGNAQVEEICQPSKDGVRKSLPKLYVLGAQKGGTSSLATDLSCTGIEPVAGTDDKEFHFFDGHSKWRGDLIEKNRWLERLPECNKTASIRGEPTALARMVSDFTPNNLRMVEGETTYSGMKVEVPQMIRKWYGSEDADKLTFVLMVREPLSRMQSAWYAAALCGDFHAICRDDCRAPSFQDALNNVLTNATKEDPVFTEWIWTSMYGRHLEQWLEHFHASQFYVIPYREYSQGDADSICRDISGRMNFSIDCDSKGAGVTHLWASGHKPLEEDMTQQLSERFKNVMDKENERFVKALAIASQHGLGLANFKGNVGNAEEIRTWLENGW